MSRPFPQETDEKIPHPNVCGGGTLCGQDSRPWAAEGKTKGTTIVVPFFLVRLKGFEPPTYWFVASHSIQLSYSRIP